MHLPNNIALPLPVILLILSPSTMIISTAKAQPNAPAVDPVPSKSRKTLTATEYVDQGITQYKRSFTKEHNRKELNRALDAFTKAIRLDPEHVNAWKYRGKTWYWKQEYNHVITDFSEALRLDPKNVKIWCFRGDAWDRKKKYDKAIEDYSAALQIDPKNVIALQCRGDAYYHNKEYRKANMDFEEVLTLKKFRHFFWLNFIIKDGDLLDKSMWKFEEAPARFRQYSKHMGRSEWQINLALSEFQRIAREGNPQLGGPQPPWVRKVSALLYLTKALGGQFPIRERESRPFMRHFAERVTIREPGHVTISLEADDSVPRKWTSDRSPELSSHARRLGLAPNLY